MKRFWISVIAMLVFVPVLAGVILTSCAAPTDVVDTGTTSDQVQVGYAREKVDVLYYDPSGKTPIAFKIVDGQTVVYGVVGGGITVK